MKLLFFRPRQVPRAAVGDVRSLLDGDNRRNVEHRLRHPAHRNGMRAQPDVIAEGNSQFRGVCGSVQFLNRRFRLLTQASF